MLSLCEQRLRSHTSSQLELTIASQASTAAGSNKQASPKLPFLSRLTAGQKLSQGNSKRGLGSERMGWDLG